MDDPDPERARLLCAAVTRDLLGEIAPALILLSPRDRQRLQALTAYTRTLFDLALEKGMHGERLARINRWEFSLEQALEGEPPGQPVFVAMASTHADHPWDRDALDTIAAAARRAAIASELGPSISSLVAALCTALTGHRASPQLTGVGSRLLLTISRRRGAQETSTIGRPDSNEALARDEITRLPLAWRRALVFLSGAAARIEHRGPDDRSSLGLPIRIRLLARAWLSR